MAQEAVKQKKVTEATPAEAAILQAKEGQEVFAGQEVEDIGLAEEGADPGTNSTQLKRPHVLEGSGPQKYFKALRLAINPITLTEGDLYDISETVHDVTKEEFQEVIMEWQTVLGALRVQLQELQLRPP